MNLASWHRDHVDQAGPEITEELRLAQDFLSSFFRVSSAWVTDMNTTLSLLIFWFLLLLFLTEHNFPVRTILKYSTQARKVFKPVLGISCFSTLSNVLENQTCQEQCQKLQW